MSVNIGDLKVGTKISLKQELEVVSTPVDGGVFVRDKTSSRFHIPVCVIDRIISQPKTKEELRIEELEKTLAETQEELSKLKDGWIKWTGGYNPAPNRFVSYMTRRGYTNNKLSNSLEWEHYGDSSDICWYCSTHSKS
jgi:hypothetical protein